MLLYVLFHILNYPLDLIAVHTSYLFGNYLFGLISRAKEKRSTA